MAEKPILTRQQLEDAMRCLSIESCKECSLYPSATGYLECIMVTAQTALALSDKIEQKDKALSVARDALTSILMGPFLMHDDYTNMLKNALSAVDKALGGRDDASS